MSKTLRSEAAIASGDSLVFTSANASASNTLTNTLATTFNLAAITYNSGALSYTMTGNAFNLTGGIINNSGSLQTINNAITLSNATHAFNAAEPEFVELGRRTRFTPDEQRTLVTLGSLAASESRPAGARQRRASRMP